MYIVEKKHGVVHSHPAKEISIKHMGNMRSPLAQRILLEIAKKQNYPKAIAKILKENEQKIYYHIRKLEKSGFIEIVKTTFVGGAKTQYYALTQSAFVLKLKETTKQKEILADSYGAQSFLTPFIQDAKMNSLIIVGSPDPHGPQHARSRDGYYGMDLALFLGSYINEIPQLAVRLDTEVTDDELRNNNIILLGGPVVNAVVEKVQKKMPIFIKKGAIHSEKTRKEYYNEETGFVVRMKNPFNPKKMMLAIAGLRYVGTRACMILFLKHFDKLLEKYNEKEKIFSCILEGYDMDSDGIVDEAKILE